MPFLLIIQVLRVLAFSAVHQGNAVKKKKDKAELNDYQRSGLIATVWVCGSCACFGERERVCVNCASAES